jgi:FtsP/CotA-like multicopper oxidase with cupredoxin domain
MGKQVTIRTKFKQWIGKSVFHCHILPHEDTGMMQNFTIHDPKTMKNHGLKKNG